MLACVISKSWAPHGSYSDAARLKESLLGEFSAAKVLGKAEEKKSGDESKDGGGDEDEDEEGDGDGGDGDRPGMRQPLQAAVFRSLNDQKLAKKDPKLKGSPLKRKLASVWADSCCKVLLEAGASALEGVNQPAIGDPDLEDSEVSRMRCATHGGVLPEWFHWCARAEVVVLFSDVTLKATKDGARRCTHELAVFSSSYAPPFPSLPPPPLLPVYHQRAQVFPMLKELLGPLFEGTSHHAIDLLHNKLGRRAAGRLLRFASSEPHLRSLCGLTPTKIAAQVLKTTTTTKSQLPKDAKWKFLRPTRPTLASFFFRWRSPPCLLALALLFLACARVRPRAPVRPSARSTTRTPCRGGSPGSWTPRTSPRPRPSTTAPSPLARAVACTA